MENVLKEMEFVIMKKIVSIYQMNFVEKMKMNKIFHIRILKVILHLKFYILNLK